MLIATFAEKNHLMHLNLYSKLISYKLLEYRYILKNERLKRQIFDRPALSGFTKRELTTEKELNTQKKGPFYFLT